jgi:beta-aspartyl-peptidase (threonine type)
VALDRCGRTAAGTSTGGYDTKAPGRVGDVPVIGAGTYADPEVALSATGWGEWFIRQVGAHDVAARMRYGGEKLRPAMKATLRAIEAPAGATGGFIGLTAAGAWAAEHTSPGMLRGVVTHAAPAPRVGIFEPLRGG